tara:strand:- start:355 stop:519 length:165 start_codon:yes stop_codon:yes gene_type:complete
MLKPRDRWFLECAYDGPIPLRVLKDKIRSYNDAEDFSGDILADKELEMKRKGRT